MQAGKIQRVLIIDDNELDISNEQRILEDYCANSIITVCRSGRAALREITAMNEVPVDLILMDVNLEGGAMDLLAALEEYASQWLYAPVVIMLNASSDPGDLYRAKFTPMIAEYVQKPIVPEFLQYLLEFHFEREGLNGPRYVNGHIPF